jgi:GT2 family glycosyltransferase
MSVAKGTPGLRTVSVIVPTWDRAASVERCVRALAAQSRAPEEILVATRHEDKASRDAAAAVPLPEGTRLVLPVTTVPGVIAAMAAALDVATGDVIALTDDDAEPGADWIERLVAALTSDARVGGVGGRDLQPSSGVPLTAEVGRLQWFGRVIGGHHLGTGPAREVDVLKGVNAAFRAVALRKVGFDRRLRGAGAQQHWELGLCLALRRGGWRLIYDPSITVAHHVEGRGGDDQIHRGRFGAAPLADAVHNETLAVLEHFGPAGRVAFLLWEWLLGTVAAPGALNALRLRAQGHAWAFDAWRATRAGRRLGIATYESSRDAARGPAARRT